MVRFLSGLRFRLFVLILLALLPALGLVIYTASEQRRLAAAQAQENALRLARAAASSQEQLVEGAHQLLIVLAQIPAVRDIEPAACNAFLSMLLRQYPHYLFFGVVARDGEMVCGGLPFSRPLNVGDDPVHLRVLETLDFAVSEYRIGPVSGRRAFAFGYPLFDEDGRVRAVVVASIDVAWINQLAARSLMRPGSTLTAYDRKGIILARYPNPEDWVGRSAPQAIIAQIIQNGRGEGTGEAVGEDNVPRLYAVTTLRGVPDNDVFLSVGIPTAEAFAEADQGLVRNLAALGLVAMLALTAAWVGGDTFLLRQVNALLRVTERMVAGDLTARTGIGHGAGELNQLARAFDKMGDALEQRERERDRSEEEIRRWSAELETLLNTVAEAISQSLEVSEIADIALGRTLSVMGLPSGYVFLKRSECFELVARQGLPGGVQPAALPQRLSAETTAQIDKLVHPAVSSEVADERLATALASGAGSQTWLSVPIKSKGRVFGVMCLVSQEQRTLQAHEQSVLAAVGQQVGVAIENVELYEQVQSIAALRERERLSRELHDGLAQVLGHLCVGNNLVADMIAAGESERAQAQVRSMQEVTQEAYQDVREAILGLRVTVSSGKGLVPTLKEYAHKFGLQTGIRVNLVPNGNDRIECSPEAEVQLLRIIQEALSNIRKHSEARQASIRIDIRGGQVTVTIEDEGKGFDVRCVGQDGRQHYGLQTMRERAEGAGGQFQVQSAPGLGTRILVTLDTLQRAD